MVPTMMRVAGEVHVQKLRRACGLCQPRSSRRARLYAKLDIPADGMENPRTTMLESAGMFSSERSPALRALDENYIQPHLGHALRIWWAFYWPTTLISFVLGILLGLVVRVLPQTFSLSTRFVGVLSQVWSYLLSYTTALFIFKYVLGKRFRHFRIVLRPVVTAQRDELLPTYARALRVWWTFVWRTLAYTLAGSVVVLMPLGWYLGLFRPAPFVAFLLTGGAGFLLGASISLYVIYSSILDEEFDDFRVTLAPRSEAAVGPEFSVVGPQF